MKKLVILLGLLVAAALAAQAPVSRSVEPAPTEPRTAPPHRMPPAPGTAPAADTVLPFALEKGVHASWNGGQIPGLYSQDRSQGAFRFVCGGDGPLAYDDPVVHPGKPGASHGHFVWGSFEFDAFTTPESLAAEPRSNCNWGDFALNRSSYWMPWLETDRGEVVRPDLVLVYYKRVSKGSPACTKGDAQFMGICTQLPNHIRFVFGWDMFKPKAPVAGASWFCSGGTGQHYPNLDEVFASGCKPGDTLTAQTVAPNCWDGKNLDSADHRSHIAWPSYGSRGVLHCPDTHPFVIPQEENKAEFTVTADMIAADGTSRLRLSSDHMLPGGKPGATLHADYMESWDARAKKLWHDHCIDKALDCSGGDLGNGQMLAGAAQPRYGWKMSEEKARSAKPGRGDAHAGH